MFFSRSTERCHLIDVELRSVWKYIRNSESNETSPSSLPQKFIKLWDIKNRIWKQSFLSSKGKRAKFESSWKSQILFEIPKLSDKSVGNYVVQFHPSTIELWTASTDKNLYVNKPCVISRKRAFITYLLWISVNMFVEVVKFIINIYI